MGLCEEIEAYREPETRAVSNLKNPQKRSCDNLLLFSSHYMALLQIHGDWSISDQVWYENLVETFSIRPGLLSRYPGETLASSWDDHIGVACVSYTCFPTYAKLMWAYAVDNGFMYTGDFLGRFVFFMPTLKACAGQELSYFEQILAAVSFIENLWEDRQETSGKILLWHRARVLKNKYWLLGAVIGLWKWKMLKLYPRGLKDIFTIYFGSEHPLTKYAPEDMGDI